MKKPYRIILFSLIFMSFFTLNCKKDSNLNNIINIFSLQDDIKLGQQTVAQIEADPANYPVLSEAQYPQAYVHLRSIRDKILNTGLVNYTTELEWSVKIIKRDDVVNAFAIPGGYMYFYTGLIKLLDNEAQFAGVMAHEMVHVAHRHSTAQLTKVYGVELLLSAVLGENPGVLAQIAAGLASGLSSLAFSRVDENEADKYAVKYLYATDYNASSLADFFTKLGTQSSVPAFLSTHPSPDNRIQNINDEWQSLGGQTGELYVAEYQQFKNSLP